MGNPSRVMIGIGSRTFFSKFAVVDVELKHADDCMSNVCDRDEFRKVVLMLVACSFFGSGWITLVRVGFENRWVRLWICMCSPFEVRDSVEKIDGIRHMSPQQRPRKELLVFSDPAILLLEQVARMHRPRPVAGVGEVEGGSGGSGVVVVAVRLLRMLRLSLRLVLRLWLRFTLRLKWRLKWRLRFWSGRTDGQRHGINGFRAQAWLF